ncbi:MAG TPA: ABC transporter permease [Solirubrobacteraceae bacterium]|jgi:ABC-type nitrate/sulfonate/bicarbonate transport system permease component|nr:ABC transporter permease [Solirubrobacteraceae bacterium]
MAVTETSAASVDAVPALGREAGRRPIRIPAAKVVEPTLCVLAFLGLFEIVALTNVFGDDNVIPSLDQIARALWHDVVHGPVLEATWVTIRSWGLAMLIVIAVSIPLGILLGVSRIAYHSTHLTVEILRTVPSIAAIPFLVLLYGVGTKITVILVLLASTWPLLLQTMDGVHDVDPVARETGRVYGLSGLSQFRQIVFPSALPYIATGLRLSGTLGLLLAIGASLFVGGGGLGYLIQVAQGTFNTPLVFARTFVAGLLGLVVYYALVWLERRVLAWHPSYRGDGA